MIPYQTRIKKLPGTSYAEVKKEALKEKELFLIQVKENKKTRRKYFISCFPWKIK